MVEPCDLLFRVGTIHTLDPALPRAQALAVRDATVIAVAPDSSGLDALVGPATRIVDAPALTLLPAFADNHNHLLEATHNLLFVPVDQARTLAAFLDLIRQRAAMTPAGAWLQTSSGWHEQQLVEQRLPTAKELDSATREHPVLVRRGGHMAVVNSLALAQAGITRETPDPPGGRLGREPDGTPNGILEGGAQYALLHVPPPPPAEQLGALERLCRQFAASGIGTVRDAVVAPDGVRLCRMAAAQGQLTLRWRAMLLMSPVGSVADRIAQLDGLGLAPGEGDDWVRVWGLKFVLDGGVDGAALDQPYVSDPAFTGHLNWEPDDLYAVVLAAVGRGWRVGTHAVGDRAVRTLLDVYERVMAAEPALPAGTLVMEHGFLADRVQRARAIRLGVAITVQPALLYGLGAEMVRQWGPERAREVMPVRAWLTDGAELSAGTDYPISFYEPVRGLWGLTTRQTERAGVQGPESAIDRATAVALYTTGTARLNAEADRLGRLAPGYLADLVAFATDPLTCPTEALPGLAPILTLVGGRGVHDPEGRLDALR
jgi:predicted amidohydrolase YtcJ